MIMGVGLRNAHNLRIYKHTYGRIHAMAAQKDCRNDGTHTYNAIHYTYYQSRFYIVASGVRAPGASRFRGFT